MLVSSPASGKRPTLRQRLDFLLARGLFGMPVGWQQRLFARTPLVIDGCTLDPSMQTMLKLLSTWPYRAVPDRVPARMRERFRHETATISGSPPPLGRIADLAIDIEE